MIFFFRLILFVGFLVPLSLSSMKFNFIDRDTIKKKPQEQELSNACKNGDIQKVAELLKNGVRTEFFGLFDGCKSPLEEALGCNNIEPAIINLLIEYGANTQNAFFSCVGWDKKDKKNIKGLEYLITSGICSVNTQLKNILGRGQTALHVAILEDKDLDNLDIIKMLLDKKADCTIADRESKTPLYYAVESGKREIFELIFKYMINCKVDCMIADREGKTPLHWACAAKSSNLEIIKMLLDQKADRMIPDMDGVTPLHIVARNNDPALFRELVLRPIANECKKKVQDLGMKLGYIRRVPTNNVQRVVSKIDKKLLQFVVAPHAVDWNFLNQKIDDIRNLLFLQNKLHQTVLDVASGEVRLYINDEMAEDIYRLKKD